MGCPADCRIPEAEHYCWARAIEGHECFGELTHQHRPKKGMGGNNPDSKVVAILCAGIHDQLDNNAGRPYKDEVRPYLNGMSSYYRIYDPSRDHIQAEYALVWKDITDWTGGSAAGDTAFRAVVESTPVSAEPLSLPDELFAPLPAGMEYEDWRRWLVLRYEFRRAATWALIDAIEYGERNYADLEWDAIGDTGMEEKTIQNYKSIAVAYQGDLRSRARELSFGVLSAIAPVARQSALEGRETVERAIAERWSVEQARAEVKALRTPDGYEAPEQHECPECHHKHRRKA